MSRVLEVPLLEADSVLTIDVATDLPEDPSEICQLLAAEDCATKWWLAIAAAYSEQGFVDAAIHVATSGLRESKKARTDEDKAPFHSMLSWLYIRKVREAPAAEMKTEFDKALKESNRGLEGYQSTLTGNASRLSVPAVLAQAAAMEAVGNTSDTFAPFSSVLSTQPENFMAKLGRARVLYERGQFRAALRLYQDVLRQLGTSTDPRLPDPRIGIGLCFWHLNDRLKARLAWERVLSRPTSSAVAKKKAHAMLGTWFLDASLNGVRAEFEPNYREAISHFQWSYKLGEFPLPSLKLASYLFSKHDLQGVAKLTDRVLATASKPSLLAEALFWKARAAHYTGDLVDALALYTQAITADDQNVAAAIGKGIVELAQDRAAEALLTFELVVMKFPKNSDALFYAGVFAVLNGGHATGGGGGDGSPLGKPRELLQSYLAVCRSSNRTPRYEALVLLSELLERENPAEALQHLEEALKLLRVEHKEAPVALLINLSALAFALAQYSTAEHILEELATRESESTPYTTTIAYNLARVRESLGQDSTKEYERLHTVDSRARLILNAPAEEMKSFVDAHAENLELRALYTWYLRRAITSSEGDRSASRQAAEKEAEFVKQTLAQHDKHDAYALVAMGNIYLGHAQQYPKSEVSRRQRAYMRAGEFFEKALQVDKFNAYAAQGVAIALAETKRAEVAVPLLDRVRESLRFENAATLMNSAHLQMEVGDYAMAAEYYELALSQIDKATDKAGAAGASPGRRADLLSYLARAYLAKGWRHKDTQSLEKAVEFAKLAKEAHETHTTSFNLAYVQMRLADVLYRQPIEQRTLSQLEMAQPWLEEAVAEFRKVLDAPEFSMLPFKQADVEEKLEHAESVLVPQLAQAAIEQREHYLRSEAKREEARRVREEEQRRKVEERERLAREKQERDAQLAAERERLQAQAAEWEAEREALREQMRTEPEEKKSKKRGKKKLDDLVDDSEMPDLPSDHESGDEGFKIGDDENNDENGEGDEEPKKIERKQAVMDDEDSDDDLF